MSRWNKEAALAELELLTDQIRELESARSMSAEHVRWLARAAAFLEQVFGPSSLYSLSLGRLRWKHTGSLIIQSFNIQGAIDRRDHEAYLQDLDAARGLLQAAHDELNRSEMGDVFKAKDGPEESSGILRILGIAERKLRKAIRQPPTKEKEVQDSFETLLIGADIEYSREAENVQYSTKSYIPDFVVRKLDLAIEMKLCVRPEREKEIIAEINDDILAYKQKYRNVIFVIYDVGSIRDVDQFSSHFEENEGVLVRVVKQ
jgi:hypothetical protein